MRLPENTGGHRQGSDRHRYETGQRAGRDAADIMKIAMINVDKALKNNNLVSRIVLQVHDELLIEAKKEEVEQVKDILINEMSQAANLEVPLLVEAEVGNNWDEAH